MSDNDNETRIRFKSKNNLKLEHLTMYIAKWFEYFLYDDDNNDEMKFIYAMCGRLVITHIKICV